MVLRGIVDQFTAVRGCPRIHCVTGLQPGMRVKVCRLIRRASSPLALTPPSIITICTVRVKSVPRDRRNRPTNQILFTEPLPDEVEAGDLLIWEGKR